MKRNVLDSLRADGAASCAFDGQPSTVGPPVETRNDVNARAVADADRMLARWILGIDGQSDVGWVSTQQFAKAGTRPNLQASGQYRRIRPSSDFGTWVHRRVGN